MRPVVLDSNTRGGVGGMDHGWRLEGWRRTCGRMSERIARTPPRPRVVCGASWWCSYFWGSLALIGGLVGRRIRENARLRTLLSCLQRGLPYLWILTMEQHQLGVNGRDVVLLLKQQRRRPSLTRPTQTTRLLRKACLENMRRT